MPQEDENYQKLSLFFTGDVKKAVTVNSNINSYYVLKDDGSIYNYVLSRDEENKTFYVKSDNVQFTSNSYDGKIIDFFYAGDSTATFFRTPTSIYFLPLYIMVENYLQVMVEYLVWNLKIPFLYRRYYDFYRRLERL